jgi:hypothetical protein
MTIRSRVGYVLLPFFLACRQFNLDTIDPVYTIDKQDQDEDERDLLSMRLQAGSIHVSH